MQKDFAGWIKIKEKLHHSSHKPPYFKKREIWWCSIGENIGTEANGKNKFFRRPVVIVKKLDAYSFVGVPLTTKVKEGTWYVKITHGGSCSVALINQVRYFDYRRLDKKMATLDEADFSQILEALKSLMIQN